MFKKIFVAVVIIAVVGLGSCKKIEELLTFNSVLFSVFECTMILNNR